MNKILKTLLTVVLFFFVGTAVNVKAEGNVAEIGDVEYATLSDAVDAIKNNEQKTGEITLLASVSGEQINLNDKDLNVTIDLNGHDISSESQPFLINNGSLTLKGSGNVYETKENQYAGIVIRPNYAKLEDGKIEVNVGKDVTVAGWAGIFISFDPSLTTRYNGNVVVNLEGTAKSPGMDSHTVVGHGIYVNGELKNTNEYANINLKDGSKVIARHVENGDSEGLYLAGYAKTTVGNNVEVKGSGSAIEIRAGILNINGGSFTSTYTGDTETKPNGSGSTTVGAAIVIAQHTTKLPIEVNITNGEFVGSTALYEVNPQNNSSDDINKVKLNVTGGTFTSTSTTSPVAAYSQDFTSFVQGGSFSSDVSKYLVEGNEVVKVGDKYKVVTDGTNTVEVTANTLAYDEQVVNHIQKYATSDELDEIESIEPIVLTAGDTYEEHDVTKEWEASDYKKAFDEYLKDVENVDEVIPYNIALHVTDKKGTNDLIDELDEKLDFTLFLNDASLSKVKDKKFTLYNIYYNQTDKKFEVTPVTSEKTTVAGNSISFATDRFSVYALVTFKEVTPTPTPTASSETKKSSGGWDDGGPFTTDTCGNVFDRWGNKIYEAKGCNVGGYNLVRTSVED